MTSSTPLSSNSLPSLSSALLDRVRQMQPEAWARLVNVYSPIVYRWSRQAGLSGADSSDVVQDVFLAVAKKIRTFERQKETGSFRSWLATIARNRVRDSFRKRDQYPLGQGGTEALERFHDIPNPNSKNAAIDNSDSSDKPQHSASSTTDNLENSISLKDLDHRLPIRILEIVKSECDPRTWRAFWLTTVQGDLASDVAERLEMPLASVYQAKSRTLRRLRKRMEELP